MGLFDWFKQDRRFVRCDDMFATTRPGLWRSLKKSVESPIHKDKSIWLVAHFTDSFLALQSELESWQIDYEVVTKPIDANQLQRSELMSGRKVHLLLASLFPPADDIDVGRFEVAENEGGGAMDSSPPIAIIVVERHPQITCDDKIESFARSLPAQVEFGYFNSLDDEVVGQFINETSLMILKQLGLSDDELITSSMVSRRLEKVLRRLSPTYQTNHPADSVAEWLRLNRSSTN